MRSIARAGWKSTKSSSTKPKRSRVAVRSSGRRIEVEVVVDRDRVGVAPGVQLAPAPEIDRRVERAVDAWREFGLQVREVAALPRQIVMTKADPSAVLARDSATARAASTLSGSEQMLSTTTRSAAVERPAQDAGVDWVRRCTGVDRVDREAGDDDVVGLAGTLDRAGDPPGLEAELV